MAELKYTYALDDNENCVNIENAQKGIEYLCPHCKGKMVVKEGSVKVKHYAHKIRPQDCSYETYLHALAKKRIEEWFNSDETFNISFRTKDRCPNFAHCLWNHNNTLSSYCEKESSQSFNLKNYYNVITREKTYKGFRADLLLTNSENKHEPVFIEILVSHQCEKGKLVSGIRIIEVVLNSEYELNTIIQSGTISENERVNFYNFKRKCGISETEGLMLNKFVLLDSMQGFCPSNRSNCKIYTQRHSSAIFEITFDYLTNHTTTWINPFVFGWAIAYKNYENVKNCFLCKYYKENYYNQRLCCLYKKKGFEKYCKSNQAIGCNEFTVDESVISENHNYLPHITYNVWEKGMDKYGVDYDILEKDE